MYNLISSAFSSLNLDLSAFPDIPKRKVFNARQINIRRLKTKYRFEHDGLPCVSLHGSGVRSHKDRLVDTFDEYWGKNTRLDMPPYCSKVIYVRMDSLTKTNLDTRLATLLKQVRRDDSILLREMILITHGMGGAYLNTALFKGHLQLHRTVRWLSLNTPHWGFLSVQYMRESNCNKGFENLIQEIAKDSRSKLEMTCEKMTNYELSRHFREANQRIKHLSVSASLCGAVASHKRWQQKRYLSFLEKPWKKNLPKWMLNDGMSNLGSCLRFDKAGEVLPGFSILAKNYWDSQMKVADRINSGGVRHWLYVTSRQRKRSKRS